MPTYIKGEKVANATSYELHEKVGDSYNKLAEKNEIDFEVSAIELTKGNHTLVVKAQADGYEDSDYSNEVVYASKGILTTGEMTPYESVRGYVSFDTGNISTGNQYVEKYEVIPGTKCYYSGAILGSAGVAMASFYDENNNWIGNNGVKSTSTRVDHTDYEFTIPVGAVYMYCTSYADNIKVVGDYYV